MKTTSVLLILRTFICTIKPHAWRLTSLLTIYLPLNDVLKSPSSLASNVNKEYKVAIPAPSVLGIWYILFLPRPSNDSSHVNFAGYRSRYYCQESNYIRLSIHHNGTENSCWHIRSTSGTKPLTATMLSWALRKLWMLNHSSVMSLSPWLHPCVRSFGLCDVSYLAGLQEPTAIVLTQIYWTGICDIESGLLISWLRSSIMHTAWWAKAMQQIRPHS